MNVPSSSGASLKTWLLRIFLGSFLIAVAAPVCLALAILNISADTRALRNSAIGQEGAGWKKTVELNVGSAPFLLARMALPFLDVPVEASKALEAVRAIEVSVHESIHEPDRVRTLAAAEAQMAARGWEPMVRVLQDDTAVAVYTLGNGATGDLRIATLVLNGRTMVAVTGRGRLQPLLELVMRQMDDNLAPEIRGEWLARR